MIIINYYHKQHVNKNPCISNKHNRKHQHTTNYQHNSTNRISEEERVIRIVAVLAVGLQSTKREKDERGGLGLCVCCEDCNNEENTKSPKMFERIQGMGRPFSSAAPWVRLRWHGPMALCGWVNVWRCAIGLIHTYIRYIMHSITKYSLKHTSHITFNKYTLDQVHKVVS